MRKPLWIVMVILAALLVMAGCGQKKESAETSEEKVSIKHELGTSEVPESPKRIVTLELSFVDALNGLGMEPVGIADDKKEDMIKNLVGKKIDYTSVGTRQQPNLEVISSLQPDLIIADVQRHKGIYEDLKKIAPTIELKSRESDYEENLDAFQTIAKAVGKEKQSEERLSEHKETLAKLQDELKEEKGKTIMPAVVRDTSFQAHTSASYDGQFLEKLGFKNAIQDDEAYAEMNLEQLSDVDPDVLILANNEGKLLTDEWKDNPLWRNLKAVKNDQVYVVDRDLWTRFRGVVSAEAIGKDTVRLLNEE
ncbi:Fe(3+) dicitrate ABC transporter substrate-binding protein [Rossellomorea marisflavi]|uniref:ABC transporter substrate-binding protein n=1 Tax=Rossellomorea marisflavi TaxID=189381 RepID=UPI00285300E5|nr:Fe(3+) dicitrate ABC transporter substrate-binding protein [Rossellomorea marisflavi]MDR4937932.1 Fe(3+) dicitrate ABC transporter substrate-binding protein [Rossellomorea marisflavi]